MNSIKDDYFILTRDEFLEKYGFIRWEDFIARRPR